MVGAWGQPGATIRQILSYDAAGEVVELKRNLRVLSAMATLGPLLGLLGTVFGIIQSFDALGGRVGPSRGEALAHGISLALVATAFGLAIAIVAVTFYYFFLNRVDLLVRELDEPHAAGHRAGLGRGAAARPDGSASRAARRGRRAIARSRGDLNGPDPGPEVPAARAFCTAAVPWRWRISRCSPAACRPTSRRSST